MSDISEYYKYDQLKSELDDNDKSPEAKLIRRNAKKYFEKCGLAISMMINRFSKKSQIFGLYLEG